MQVLAIRSSANGVFAGTLTDESSIGRAAAEIRIFVRFDGLTREDMQRGTTFGESETVPSSPLSGLPYHADTASCSDPSPSRRLTQPDSFDPNARAARHSRRRSGRDRPLRTSPNARPRRPIRVSPPVSHNAMERCAGRWRATLCRRDGGAGPWRALSELLVSAICLRPPPRPRCGGVRDLTQSFFVHVLEKNAIGPGRSGAWPLSAVPAHGIEELSGQ